MSNKINLVVVGPGLIGKKHISLINNNSDLQLSAIVAPDHEINHEIAKINKAPLFFSLEDCLNYSIPDGVIISSPNQFHAEQGRTCIEAGIPVLIEKPITSSLKEGFDLVELVKQNQAKVLIGHHRAHSPLMAKARELINEGTLGKLVTIMGSAQFYKPDHYFDDGPWRKEIGGGPILINLIHEIGNLRSLCGEIESVQAIASSDTRNFAVEDTVVINLKFVSGVLGTFVLSDVAASAASWEQTSQENPSYPSYSDEDCYLVSGTKGSISIPTMRIKYFDKLSTPSWWSPFQTQTLNVIRDDPLNCQLLHFTEMIKNNIAPLVSAFDGLKNLIVTEAIRESAIKEKLIKIS